MTDRTCTIDGCTQHVRARGWCAKHYEQWRVAGGLGQCCSIDDCDRAVASRGWCKAHYKRWMRTGDPAHEFPSVGDRWIAKINQAGPLPEFAPHLGPCWIWTGTVGTHGYGQFKIAGWPYAAHRFTYELMIGPIPEGLELDHLCRVTACVNPAHLEPVTGWENQMRSPVAPSAINARKTQCIHGHPFDEVNTYRPPGKPSWRMCRTCMAEGQRRRRATARR